MARFLFLFLAGLTAANVCPASTSASCSFGSTSQMVSDPSASACAIPVVSPVVHADAQASEDFTPFSGDLFTSAAAVVNSANPPPGTQYQLSSKADTGNIRIVTPGPLRQGLVSFDFEGTNLPGGSADAFIGDGSREYTLQIGVGFHCQPCSYTATMPITLGSSNLFVDQAAGTFLTGAFPNGVPTSQAATMELKFSLFEADGVTPVAMVAIVPEPSSFGLLLAGAGFVLAVAGGMIRRPFTGAV